MLRKILTYDFFAGRANRKEFILGMILVVTIFFIEYLLIIYDIGFFIPFYLVPFITLLYGFSIIIRRTRDIGLSLIYVNTICILLILSIVSLFTMLGSWGQADLSFIFYIGPFLSLIFITYLAIAKGQVNTI